ncbi:Succinoglycan biosynthesis protein exoV [Chitinispirillum alkaliphilum]|nr:Succinoglycan biosynthesis protein exoV [Chitinispirillum alkaliphilum]
MKLYYYKSTVGNFGDDINSWLWPRIIPNFDKIYPNDWLVGIGTILNSRLNRLEGKKWVFGTGFRPKDQNKQVQLNNCEFLFVRGRLSCQHLGLNPRIAIADAATLLPTLIGNKTNRSTKIGFMPHYHTCEAFNCAAIANLANCSYIDPRQPISTVIDKILSVDRLVTEAMHGAIVADAYGIPWARIAMYSIKTEGQQVANFKWADWGGQFDLETEPAVFHYMPYNGKTSLNRIVKRPYVWLKEKEASKVIREIAHSTLFRCSASILRNNRIEQLQECIESFNRKLLV